MDCTAAAPYGAASGLAMAILVKSPFFRVCLALHEVRVLAPEHELADRVGELTVRNGEPLLDRFPRPLVVGREEDLERRRLRDLSVQLTSRAEAQDRLVAGLLLEDAAISLAASVKLAATATLVSPARAG